MGAPGYGMLAVCQRKSYQDPVSIPLLPTTHPTSPHLINPFARSCQLGRPRYKPPLAHPPPNESGHAGGHNDARSTAQGCSHKALPRKICVWAEEPKKGWWHLGL